MIEAIPWGPVVGFGSGWAIVGYVVYNILTGKLMPARFYDASVADLKQALEAVRLLTEQNAELGRQNGHLAEVGETVKAIFLALRNDASRTRGTDEET